MYIVCVTACPVGIAHTYMAAANLKKAAEKRGLEVKVETQGAQGLENEITQEDIDRAAAVIIASDVKIRGRERFSKTPTLSVRVAEAVKIADDIIEELLEAIS